MMTYSKILNRYYDAENVVFITNMLQCQRYLNNGRAEDFVSILYRGAQLKVSLVFVFKKTPLVKELYRKWQAHELN